MAKEPNVRSELRVVAAVMEREGKILICQRKATDRHGLKWEFPGGKVEPDEDPKAALVRELNEELGITAKIEEEIARYEYQYPGRAPILLIFYRVKQWKPEPENLIFASMIWEKPAKFRNYDFLDGDLDFVRRLARSAS